ncbi:uncharacterized protein BDR25DRAFT_308107 [Lindgomyces ingoldianus]|uniref:Uncharacterized protein n=1 Tax=Lindgomyces ingoldianus TaxID=673940 RepID=A0ACB6Q787_9PLEO|nr:uncharacterized protein BDR25DRAFT_308107 [Lindgomyces ingoldianus]KAF2462824.1 hypothetical protein BDR25DRAFT_308107 [Lindgomyces ingoldianus]
MSTTTLTANHLEKPPVDIKTLSDKEKQELISSDSVSITSGTTLSPDTAFQPAKSLHINTKGTPVLRLPLPLKELQISIHNADGSLAYLSTRAQRNSGNCVLSNADEKQSIATTYFFGPGRDPVLHLLGEDAEIKTASKWTSRSQKFIMPDGRSFEWEYKRAKGFGDEGKKGTALVLSMGGKRLAALIRNSQTRTEGSKSCSAGNGGELVLGEDVGGKEGLSEDVVVATCLLMLKKEVDRRRTVQIMMITAAVSGGS